MELNEAHRSIKQRLTLRREGGGRCWLIDHGLDATNIKELTARLGEALRERDLAADRDTFWNWRYLPLLVVAVEVGYQYGKDENSFWPRLSDRLNAPFTDAHRRVLAEFFSQAAASTGVRPPSVPWADHFTLIRWPITHAVLPMWQHEPLLDLVARCPVPVDASGAHVAQLAAQANEVHNLALLFADAELAVAVVNAVLELPTNLLSPELGARLRRDVQAVPGARRALQRARKRQIRLRGAAPQPPPAPRKAAARVPARPKHQLPLALRIDGDAVELWLPPFAPTDAVERAADRARVALRGERRRHLLRNVLQFGERWDGAPTLSTEDALETAFETGQVPGATEHERVALSMIGVALRAPLVFSPRVGPAGYAGQLQSRAVSSRTPIWVLSEQRPPSPRREQPLGEVTAFELDPAADEVATWLREQGVAVEDDAVVTGLGSPAFGAPGATLGPLLSTDVLALDIAGASVRAGDQELSPGLHLISVAAAEDLSIALQKRSRALELPVSIYEGSSAQDVVEVELLGGAVSSTSLRARSHTLRVSGRWPLAGLMVSARLVRGDHLVARAWSGPLPPLPCALPSTDALWRIADHAGDVTRGEAVRLVIDVGGLGELDITLEEGAAWWGGALSRSAAPGRGRATAAKPWVISEGEEHPGDELLLVVDSGNGGPATGWVVPGVSPSGPQPAPTPPGGIRRLLEAAGSALTGRSITQALHLWAAASTPDPLTDGRRRVVVRALDAWSAEALCGPTWARVEGTLPDRSPEVAAVLADGLLRSGVTLDDDVELGDHQRSMLVTTLARGLRGHEAWLLDLAQLELDDLDGDTLTALSDLISGALSDAWRATGLSSDAPDPPCRSTETRQALGSASRAIRAAREITPLLQLVFPAAARDRLAELGEWANGDALVSEAARELGTRPAGAVPWADGSVRALVTLWTNPREGASLSAAELRAPLDDLHGARMVRYLCLRARAQRGHPR